MPGGEFESVPSEPGGVDDAPRKPLSVGDPASDAAASELLLRQRRWERVLSDARARMEAASRTFVGHGRAALAGIVVLMVLRVLAFRRGLVPSSYAFGMHFVAFSADIGWGLRASFDRAGSLVAI